LRSSKNLLPSFDMGGCCGLSSRPPQGQFPPYAIVERALLPPGQPPKQEAPPSQAGQCLKICCGITVGLLVLLLLLVLRVWTAECGIESFDHHYVLPANAAAAGVAEPFDRGTTANMDLTDLDVDLTGVWWMDGNPLSAEHLVSFASAEGKKPFPAEVPVYNNLAGRWTWTDDITGRFVMAYYAFDAQPDSPLVFNFKNSSHAQIVPVGGVFDGFFGFDKISDNEWDRPDANYILRRIVAGDGSQGPFWNKFIEWYDGIQPEGKILVWSSDNGCLRKCQYFMPCSICNRFC